MKISAVLWDFGGVITSSPFEAFNRFEEESGLPRDFIRTVNATNPESNAWAQLESSRITLEEFDELFARESGARGHEVRGADVLALLSGDLRPEMVNALRILRNTHRSGCITNNVRTGHGPSMSRDREKAERVAEVMELFDVVIESSKVGLRKPDPEIYRLALREMQLEPSETVFLDDLGINLKPAKQLGMKTIKVLNPEQALSELETHIGVSLR